MQQRCSLDHLCGKSVEPLEVIVGGIKLFIKVIPLVTLTNSSLS